MSQRMKVNLIVISVGLLLYAAYVVLILVLDMPFFVLLILYAAVLFSAYFINRKNIWALKGNYFYITGHMQRARIHLKKAVGGGAKSPHSHIYYALLLMKEDGEADEAFKHLEKALGMCRNEPDRRSVVINMATCHWMNNDVDAAINLIEEMRKTSEYVNASALTTLGYFYLKKENFEKAIEITNIAIENEGDYAAAWDNLGQIYFKMENFEKAKEAFEKALSLREILADSNYFMGIISEKEGKPEDAAEFFRKAAISPFSFYNTISQSEADAKYQEYNS